MEKSNLTTFYIVRHGQTDWNIEGKTQGQTDTRLNETGKQQAIELAKKLAKIQFDLVFSSDLARAKETADIIALEKKLAVETNQALRERHFGRFEGLKRDEYEKDLQKDLEMLQKLSEEQRKTYHSIDDREKEEIVTSRVITLLRELAVAHPEKQILIVSHGYVMLLLLAHFGYATMEQLPPSCIANMAYIKVASDGIDFFLEEVFGVDKQAYE